MKTRKVIKLINNERTNRSMKSVKACDSTSVDICQKYDYADCTLGSTDICVKDYAGCSNGYYDYCPEVEDYTVCLGSNYDC